MTTKRVIAAMLVVFALGSVGFMAVRESTQRETTVPLEPSKGVDPGPFPSVIIYFFDSDKECTTCSQLESYALETIQRDFAPELSSGKLQWRAINVDQPQNEHYVTEYGLYSKAVVVSRVENGQEMRWENLEDIWELVYDKPAYQEYIRANVKDFLGEAP
ncbi:MAG: hypothetical protein IT365_17040 [Candidatus Hydrogenedentes bacterium]|nr:hypothetical protein [Candidatus Hydrogenedentota bacterium]